MAESIDRARRRRRVTLIGIVAVILGALVVPTFATADGGPPITITTGGTYSGSYTSSDPNVPAIRIDTAEPVVLDGVKVVGPGTLIQISVGTPADVTVRNSYGRGTSGPSGTARFLVADTGWRSLVIENNELVSTAGIWAHHATPRSVRIAGNEVQDIVGAGMVQFVQFDKVVGPIDVGWNQVVNTPGKSSVEDVISLYMSGGTADRSARVHDNFIWGAFPDPVNGSYSGGGIMVGDQGTNAGFVEVSGNQVVGTTNYGISVVCGTNEWVTGNTILSSGRTADGTWLPATNVGLSMGSEAHWGGGCGTYSGNTAIGNDVGWQRQDGRNDWWTPDCSVCSQNTPRPGTVTYADEKAEFAKWSEKVAGRAIGRTTTSPTTTEPPGSPTPTPDSPVVTGPRGSTGGVVTTAPPDTTPPGDPTTTGSPPDQGTPGTVDPAPPPEQSELEQLRQEVAELRARVDELERQLAAKGGP